MFQVPPDTHGDGVRAFPRHIRRLLISTETTMSTTIETSAEARVAPRPDTPSPPMTRAAEAKAEAPPPAGPVQVIEPQKGFRLINIAELWRFRELLYFMTWRDVKVRYKQTWLGAGWAILKPLITVATFSIFFAFRFGDLDHEIPYYIYCFAGLVPWIYFSGVVSSSAGSVVGNAHLFTKVSFPRLLLPIGAAGECFVDLLVAFGALVVVVVYHQVPLRWEILLLPLILLGLTVGALGAGILLSALTVVYRDFRHLVPFLMTTWLFLTPISFMDPETFFVSNNPQTQKMLREVLTWIPLNPAYGLVENFRLALVGSAMHPGEIKWYSLWMGLGLSTLLLPIGLFYFRRVERTFADVI